MLLHRAEGWGEFCKHFFQQQCHLKQALLVQAKGGFRKKEMKREEVTLNSDYCPRLAYKMAMRATEG